MEKTENMSVTILHKFDEKSTDGKNGERQK